MNNEVNNHDSPLKDNKLAEDIKKQVEKENRTPITYEELVKIINKWLLLKNNEVIKVLAATIIGNKIDSDPLWLMLIAPSGGTKTELLRMLSLVEGVYPLSDLTPQTFLSGDIKNKKASLLMKLPDKTILTYKDFTTILTKHRDTKHAILSQLREIYDGYYSKEFGTGERKSWEGKLGFIAGCTPVIDKYSSLYQVLGERFLQFRLEMPDLITLATRAMDNVGDEDKMREELRNAFADYIAGVDIPKGKIELPSELKRRFANMATFCTKARSSVVRDEYTKEITLVGEPEVPTRFAKQISTYALAFTLIERGEFKDYELLYKIALDTIPETRRKILRELISANEVISTADIMEKVSVSKNTILRTLEELKCVGLLKQGEDKYGSSYFWELSLPAKSYLKNAQKESESDRGVTPQKPLLPKE